MKITMTKTMIAVVTVLMTLLMVAEAPSARAQFIEVKQIIYGMDCTPCAFNIERKLRKLDGVLKDEIEISLNEGYALVRFSPGNKTSLEEIRNIIRNNGFSPDDTRVVIEGILNHEGEGIFLTAGQKDFRLLEIPYLQGSIQMLKEMSGGKHITLRGHITKETTDTIMIMEIMH